MKPNPPDALVARIRSAHTLKRGHVIRHDAHTTQATSKDISTPAINGRNAMTATKRIVVTETVWADLSQMREFGMMFSELIEHMIEHEKKRRLVEDIQTIQEEEDLLEIEW